MFKALTPLAALLIAIGLAFTYVQPSFVAIKVIERETVEYENALKHASALQARIDEKLDQRRGFDQAGLVRLSQLLPTEVSEVDIILTLDGLARDHAMTFGAIDVAEAAADESASVTPDDTATETLIADADADLDAALMTDPVSEPQEQGLTYIDFSFTVEGTYEQLKEFTADLERSLTLFEIMSLEFEESEGDMTAFSFIIRTYAHAITE